MPVPIPPARIVTGSDGWRGELHEPPLAGRVARLDVATVGTVEVAADALAPQPDGIWLLPVTLQALRDAAGAPADDARALPDDARAVPVVAEIAHVRTRDVETGRVRVHVAPAERREHVDAVLRWEAVEVERVPAGRVVAQPEPPRDDGDVLVVPIHEEVLVVEKRLRVVEELHIRRRRGTRHATEDVVLRSERVTITRRPSSPT